MSKPTKIKPYFDPVHGGGLELSVSIGRTPEGGIIVDGQPCRDMAHAVAILSRKLNEVRLAMAKKGQKRDDWHRELEAALRRALKELE